MSTSLSPRSSTGSDTAPARTRGYRPGPVEVIVGGAILLLLLQPLLVSHLDAAALKAATTIFLAIVIQALPFLVLGVVLSAAITAFVP